MHFVTWASLWLAASLTSTSLAEHVSLFKDHRSPKVFSLFNVVTWKQTSCQSTGGSDGTLNTYGTCMTAAQCSSTSGGAALGTCAAGFGVCCVVSLSTCGGTITQNCTYVTNPGFPSTYNTAGACQFTIKKCASISAPIRLDFDQFTISAPNTITPIPAPVGACTIDSFTPNGIAGTFARPVICGDNTGQHMYLDAVDGSNANLGFTISLSSTLPNNLPRMWKIKISQLPCGRGTPPADCTQYFTGTAGTVKSYNFGSAAVPISHRLVAQNYQVCIRQQEGNCQIAYGVCPSDPLAFAVMGVNGNPQEARNGKGCTQNYVGIPDGHNYDMVCKSNANPTNTVYRYCGLYLNCIDGATNDNIIYSSTQPFGFQVYADSTDGGYATNMAKGFCLNYNQIPC